MTYDPTLGVEGVCTDRKCGCMLLHSSFPLIGYATWPCSEKKFNFNILTPPSRVGGRGVYGPNICYHVAACVIPFNLICNMTTFWKSWILASAPHPNASPPRRPDPDLRTKVSFDMFHIYCSSVCMRQFSKNIDNWLSFAKFKYLTFDPA